MGMNALPPLSVDDLDHVVSHTRGAWEKMRGKRLFLTGGTGFFGRWLLESLIAANDQLELDASVLVLSRDPGAFQTKMPHIAAHKSIRLAGSDMCTCEMKGERFDFVIHAAAEPFVPSPGADPLAVFEKNVAGTRNVLELARFCRARRLLLISSGAVYGRQPADLSHVPDDYPGAPDPLDPLTTFGQAKRASEFLCAAFGQKHGIDVVVARCFAFVGPHLPLDANYAVGNFVKDALTGGPIKVKGDGTPYRSYLYAADLAIWLWTILFRGEIRRPYNVGSEEPVTIAGLAQTVARLSGPDVKVEIAGRPVPGSSAERYVPSTETARRALGLAQTIGFEESIHRTLNWYRTP